ncbi:MAG: helix-turn-helix domain-containing protein [Actinomycetota bacterium]
MKETKTFADRSLARRTFTVEEAAAILGISRTTAYECVRSGELPSLRFRRRVVIPAQVIDALTLSPTRTTDP